MASFIGKPKALPFPIATSPFKLVSKVVVPSDALKQPYKHPTKLDKEHIYKPAFSTAKDPWVLDYITPVGTGVEPKYSPLFVEKVKGIANQNPIQVFWPTAPKDETVAEPKPGNIQSMGSNKVCASCGYTYYLPDDKKTCTLCELMGSADKKATSEKVAAKKAEEATETGYVCQKCEKPYKPYWSFTHCDHCYHLPSCNMCAQKFEKGASPYYCDTCYQKLHPKPCVKCGSMYNPNVGYYNTKWFDYCNSCIIHEQSKKTCKVCGKEFKSTYGFIKKCNECTNKEQEEKAAAEAKENAELAALGYAQGYCADCGDYSKKLKNCFCPDCYDENCKDTYEGFSKKKKYCKECGGNQNEDGSGYKIQASGLCSYCDSDPKIKAKYKNLTSCQNCGLIWKEPLPNGVCSNCKPKDPVKKVTLKKGKKESKPKAPLMFKQGIQFHVVVKGGNSLCGKELTADEILSATDVVTVKESFTKYVCTKCKPGLQHV